MQGFTYQQRNLANCLITILFCKSELLQDQILLQRRYPKKCYALNEIKKE